MRPWIKSCSIPLAVGLCVLHSGLDTPAAAAGPPGEDVERYTVLARYPFDDRTAGDATGNGHGGVIFSDPKVEEGIVGQALHFDGEDDQIIVPYSPDPQTNTVSLSLWIQVDTSPTRDAVLIRKAAGGRGYVLWISGRSGAVSFAVQNTVITAPFAVVPHVWTAMFATFDGTELRLYQHGSLVATGAATGLNIINSGPVVLSSGTRNLFFAGKLDEVTIAEGAPSPSQICQAALRIWDPASQTCLDTFTDVTEVLDVDDVEHRHFGIGLVDINDDGWIDIYYENGADNPDVEDTSSGLCPDLSEIPSFDPMSLNVCYLNQGNGTFSEDIADEAGIADFWNAMRHEPCLSERW
ncbi:MAG: LamG domain-containing protein [Acidobacteriota bacterium]